MNTLRARSVACRAVQGPKELKRSLETKRMGLLKDNFNKLAMIASADVKFITDTLTELDEYHKDLVEKIKDKAVDDSNQFFKKDK